MANEQHNDTARRSVLIICAAVLAVIAAAAGIFAAASASAPDMAAIERGDVATFNNGWVSSYSGSVLKLPYAFGGGKVTLTNTVPQLTHDSVIYINTDYAPVAATIGGDTAAVTGSFGERSYGVDGGQQWVSVELPADASGSELALTFYNTGSKADIEVYRVLIGSPAAIELLLMCNDTDDAAIAVIMAAGAVLLTAAAVFCGVKRRGHAAEAAYIAVFCALIALWIYAGSDLPAVFARGSQAVTLIWLLAPPIACLPPTLLVRDRSVKLRVPLTVLCAAQIAVMAAFAVLPAVGISTLSLFVNISHASVTVTAAALVIFTLIERTAARNTYMTLPLAAAAIAAVGVAASLIGFYTRIAADYALPLRLLLPIAAALLGVNALKLPRHADIFLPLEFAELPEEQHVCHEPGCSCCEAAVADALPDTPAYVPADLEQPSEAPATDTETQTEGTSAAVPEPQADGTPADAVPPPASFAAVVIPMLAHRNSLHALCRLRIDGINDLDAQSSAALTARIKKSLHPGDVIARSDDGYDLLLVEPTSPVVARRRAKATLAAALKRTPGAKQAALGAAIFPTDAVSYNELYSLAGAALTVAAEQSDRLAFYLPQD